MGRIEVRVAPRASRNAIEGWDAAGRLKVRLTAPPVEGAANAALIALLAEALGVAKSRIQVVRGSTGRTKVLEVAGTSESDLRGQLTKMPDSGISTVPGGDEADGKPRSGGRRRR